jgi:hypothetical protein
MNHLIRLGNALLLLLAAATPMAQAADNEKDPIADYQADLSAGAISAGEMLGLSATAISTLQSPKDFVAALNTLSAGGGKAGFGLSFTPARTRFAPVSIADYRNKLGSRAWAGTSFSYAQNTHTQGGVDYRQEAYALHMAFYLNKSDDPAVAGWEGFADCTALIQLADSRTERMLAIIKKLRADGVATEDLNEEARKVMAKEQKLIVKAMPEYKACVTTAVDQAKAKWNASQFALTLGQGTIGNPLPGTSRLSLGRIATLALALGPNPDSLVNITVRHNGKALELATLGGTPSYQSSTLVGARWTYRAIDTQDLYAVAEASNAKASSTATSNVFKYAIGVDKRLAEGMWIELRAGRNHTQDGKSEQTTALMSLKIAPQSTLAR